MSRRGEQREERGGGRPKKREKTKETALREGGRRLKTGSKRSHFQSSPRQRADEGRVLQKDRQVFRGAEQVRYHRRSSDAMLQLVLI